MKTGSLSRTRLGHLRTFTMGFGALFTPTGQSPILSAASAQQVVEPPPRRQVELDPDDYLAFDQMMLNQGRHGSERILSRLSVEAMITDQLMAEQKACFPASSRCMAGDLGSL